MRVKMQLDVGNEPYLSTAQALCLLVSHIFYYKAFANGQRIKTNLHVDLEFLDNFLECNFFYILPDEH